MWWLASPDRTGGLGHDSAVHTSRRVGADGDLTGQDGCVTAQPQAEDRNLPRKLRTDIGEFIAVSAALYGSHSTQSLKRARYSYSITQPWGTIEVSIAQITFCQRVKQTKVVGKYGSVRGNCSCEYGSDLGLGEIGPGQVLLPPD